MGEPAVTGVNVPWKVPPPGTDMAAGWRDEFIHSVLDEMGDQRHLWVPKSGDTTTNTGVDRNARTTTYAASIASISARQGAGTKVEFDATVAVATLPDTANMSFGDGASDEPFSIFAWLDVDSTAAIKEIFTKYDLTSGVTKREYRLQFDASEKLLFALYDDSAGGSITRTQDSAAATGTALFVAGTYDGSKASTGLKLFVNAAVVASTGADSSYTAMEDKAGIPRLGASEDTSGDPDLIFAGGLYVVGVCAKQLSVDELYAMKAAGNKYLDLAL